MTPSYKEYQEFAEKLVLYAGKTLLDFQNGVKIVKYKDLQDIATTADLASEKYIIDEIEKKYPDHSILSEEVGNINKGSDFCWIIDPLDGTKEYIRKIPMWNCSIALQFKCETVSSAVYRPFEKSLFSAGKYLGSFKNGEKLNVSEVERIEEAIIYCYLPSYKRDQSKYDTAFDKFHKIGKMAYRIRALSDENTALCWLAQGGIEAYMNLSNPPKIHDIAPGMLIAKEAGAIIDNENYPVLVCNNKNIYNEIIKLI